MISLDSVIALTNGFVVLDKLNSNQYIKGEESNVWLERIEYGMMKAILVVTKNYEIICSYNQKLIRDGSEVPAMELEKGQEVLTSNGVEEVTNVVHLPEYIEMGELRLKSGRFLANGFILV